MRLLSRILERPEEARCLYLPHVLKERQSTGQKNEGGGCKDGLPELQEKRVWAEGLKNKGLRMLAGTVQENGRMCAGLRKEDG